MIANLLTLRQAAERVGVTPDALRQAIHRETLTAVKLGRDWFVDSAEVDRYYAAVPVTVRETRRRSRNGDAD